MSRMAPARSSARAFTRVWLPGRSARGSGDGIGQVIAADEVLEPRRVVSEAQGDLADRAVALLGDQHLGGAVHLLEPLLPILVAHVVALVVLFGAAHRLAAAQIIFLAEDEHDDIGVLLDRSRFTQIG